MRREKEVFFTLPAGSAGPPALLDLPHHLLLTGLEELVKCGFGDLRLGDALDAIELSGPGELPGPMVGIEYRAMTEDDVPEVRSLVERTVRTSYRGVYSGAAIEFFVRYHGIEDIKRDLLEGTSIVAVTDHGIVGTATLRGDIIARVFVEPDMQGRGVGGSLMRMLLERARIDGLAAIRLDASLVSRSAYEHLGFTLVADRSHALGDGDMLPYHKMVLRL
jgi:predicted N-acetyltransferase YhbS